MEIYLGILCNAYASGLSLWDVIRAFENADCLACADEAVALLGIGAIDTTQFRFELNFKD